MASTAGDHDAVRDHILDAAHRVITRDGLADASTRAIAEEAGVGVGTLYNYFDDRLELLAASVLRRVQILSGPLHTIASRAGKGTVADNLRRSAREVSDMLDRLVPLFAAAFSDTDLLDAIRRALSSGHPPAGPFVGHPIEHYLLAEQELGRVLADADCGAAASLVLSLCHERAFLAHFLGKTGRRTSVAGEIDFIARSIVPPAPGAGVDRHTSPRRGREH
jgi:AcrR family transcriptional regulator